MATSLPVDIVLEIASHAPKRDVLSLSTSSKRMRDILCSTLYTTVDLKTSTECRLTLDAFSKRPDLTCQIHELILRPNPRWTPIEDSIDESWVASTVNLIANRGLLPGLRRFIWCGTEMPADSLWRALQKSFTNLSGFCLSMNSRRCDNAQGALPEQEEFPPRMWKMIVERCPDLETFSISGIAASRRIFDIRPLTRGRWPKLRTLELSAYISQAETIVSDGRKERIPPVAVALPGIEEFLCEHSGIETLALDWHWISTPGVPCTLLTLPRLPSTALLNMKSFSGLYQQIGERIRRGSRGQENSRSVAALQFMLLPVYPREVADVCIILRQCPSLESLSIWLALENEQDVEVGLKALLEACPKLTSLHLMTLAFPAQRLFSAKNISTPLRVRPTLKSFVFNLWHRYLDEPPFQVAVRIVHDNPNIDNLGISYLREGNPRVKHVGSYDVARTYDMRAAPSGLIVHEAGRSVWQRGYRRKTRKVL